MHPGDVVVARVVLATIAAGIVAIGVMAGMAAAIMAAISSALPVLILSAADRHFYGPTVQETTE